jgi:hypothetical protein
MTALATSDKGDDLVLRDDERKMLVESHRCGGCGHLAALHNQHCCVFCEVDDCPCEDRKP